MANDITTADQIANIDAAIEAVTKTGQEYRLGDRMVRRADLRMLWDLKRKLETRSLAEDGQRPGVASATFTGLF